MGIKLRESASGKLLRSTDGYVLTYDETTDTWSGEPASGGSSAPLSNVYYVDNERTVASPDGSIGNPYTTLTDAIDARANADFVVTFLVSPTATPYGDITLADNVAIALVSDGQQNTSVPTYGDISLGTDSYVAIVNGTCGAVAGPGSLALFEQFSVQGAVDVAVLQACGMGFQSPRSIIGVGGNVAVSQSASMSLAVIPAGSTLTVGQDLDCINCSLGGQVTVGNDFTADMYTLQSLRSSLTTPAVTGAKSVSDGKTLQLTRNVDDVSGAPIVIDQNVAFPGARPGDNFAITIVTQSGGANVAMGAPRCDTNDLVSIPAIILAGASTGSFELIVTQLPVAGMAS